MPFSAVALAVLVLAAPLVSFALAAAHLVRRLRHDPRIWLDRPWVFRPSAIVFAVWLGCFLYGWTIESKWVEFARSEIRSSRPVMDHPRFRIVHLSDLHLEEFGGREREVLELVRRAEPHLIVLTGDYLNRQEAADDLVAFLRELRAPYGVYAVPGNRDWKFRIRECFERAGVRLLADETVTVGDGLEIVGLDVRPKRRVSELASPRAAFRILLHHKPDAVDELAGLPPEARVDLFLCGHTHGGQVCLPLYGAITTLSKYHKRYERGWAVAHGTPVYVNRGVGTEPGLPVRFLARPEVAVIEVVGR